MAGFRSPPPEFSPTPFHWWAGESLNPERLAWQLDQLKAQGVHQVIVSYPHGADGSTLNGEPPLFSADWWELFRWFLGQARDKEMKVGFQDYTLVGPILKGIGLDTPGMQGGQLSCSTTRGIGPQEVRLQSEPGSLLVGAWAYPMVDGQACFEGFIDLVSLVQERSLRWQAPSGKWLVALVFARISPFDPLHPDSGGLAIERLYAPFERECPSEVGKTLKFFFQDELDFGGCVPFWSSHLRHLFQSRHQYDLWPWLPALWHDLGPLTAKVRLDYAEAVIERMERCYFEPVFRWHEQRGTLLGHDNCGRGEMRVGRHYYGDYFRTMRWYSAPGCDDPKVQGERAFKGLKTNSSIAHLYNRPRVWLEAFHSSGWGTGPAEVVAALNEDFAYGATVVNLHGLYYSTKGSWWEWAPPDFHFRQPYWEHCKPLNQYCARVSWLLSQGTHRCDVAILYPSASFEAEPRFSDTPALRAHNGHAVIDPTVVQAGDPEAVASSLAKYLFDRACDFDFIDFESLARATTAAGELRVSGERYRVLILPAMQAARLSTLEAARTFVRSGGLVIACGCLPGATERGSEDPLMVELLTDIFQTEPKPSGGRGVLVSHSTAEVFRLINELVPRDVTSSVTPLHVLHRRLGENDVFYFFNPSAVPQAVKVEVRAQGQAEQWDAWTGVARPIPTVLTAARTSQLELSLEAREARIIVFSQQASPLGVCAQVPFAASELMRFEGAWTFAVKPTMDNQFGDFRLPGVRELLGPEQRRFRWAEETTAGVDWQEAAFDDSSWPETTYSFGPRFEMLGPLAPGTTLAGQWRPYAFSLRWGIERDPFLTHWLSGPHGLKGVVPDEFLDFHCDQPGHEWHVRAQVIVEAPRAVTLCSGGRCAHQVWLNEKLVLEQAEALPPGRYAPWNIPHYECTPNQARVQLLAGANLLQLKLVQPAGQRTRAFVAFEPPQANPQYLGLRWFADPRVPRPALPCHPARRAVWLRCVAPPGMTSLRFVARGRTQVWVDGQELRIQRMGTLADGSFRFRAATARNGSSAVCLAFRVEAASEFRAGDVLPEPVQFECGESQMPLGDWAEHGLATFSGIGDYQQRFELPAIPSPGRVLLDLGDLSATAEVAVNGTRAGILVHPPWRLDVTKLLRPGTNLLSIRVANTLANHYSVGIPSPYAFSHQTRSGLFGPVRLILD